MKSSTQTGKEESMNLKEKERDVEIVHNMDSKRPEIYVQGFPIL